MKFNGTDILFALLQIVGWLGCAGSLIAALLNAGVRYGESNAPFWIIAAVVSFGSAIAATMGRVHIQSLNALDDIRFLLREQSDTRR